MDRARRSNEGQREHRVAVTGPRWRCSKRCVTRQKEFVFPGDRRAMMSNMAMEMLLRRMGCDITVHGFRSTFRDWAGERTNFPSEVAEAALAHVVGDKVEAAYRRGDLFEKRRRLMQGWASIAKVRGGRDVDADERCPRDVAADVVGGRNLPDGLRGTNVSLRAQYGARLDLAVTGIHCLKGSQLRSSRTSSPGAPDELR